MTGTGLQEGSSAATAPVAAGATNVGTIQLATDGGTVTGVVRNGASAPVAGVAVTATAGPMTRGVTTDATGRYAVTQMLAGACQWQPSILRPASNLAVVEHWQSAEL